MGDYNINTLNEMQESATLNKEFCNIVHPTITIN